MQLGGVKKITYWVLYKQTQRMKNKVLILSFIIFLFGCKVQDSHRGTSYDFVLGDRNPHELFLNSSPEKGDLRC